MSESNFKIKALYKIPALKRIFLIVDGDSKTSSNSRLLKSSKRRKRDLVEALAGKDRVDTKQIPKWSSRLTLETDFLWVLSLYKPTAERLRNLSSFHPLHLELLTISLSQYLESPEQFTYQEKVLSYLENEDIIEVYI